MNPLRQGAMRLFKIARADVGFGSMNRVTLLGNAGKDCEIVKFSDESDLARFTLATNSTYKDKDGQYVKETEWHSVIVYNPVLKGFAEKFVKKGSKVFLEGRLRQRKFVDSEGMERSASEIVLGRDSAMQVLSRSESEEQ